MVSWTGLSYDLAHVLGRARLHRASRDLGAGRRKVRYVGQILRCSLVTYQIGTNEKIKHLRGKNTCEALDIATLIWLQVNRRSEEM